MIARARCGFLDLIRARAFVRLRRGRRRRRAARRRRRSPLVLVLVFVRLLLLSHEPLHQGVEIHRIVIVPID